jgi:hypothetical protein
VSSPPLPGSRFWIVLQGIAAVTSVAAALLIEFLGSSLTPADYSARFGSVPAHLSSCAYIVPRSPAVMPGTRGEPRRQAMCFFGSRDTHQEAYVAAWVAIGLCIAFLLWTVVAGRGLRLTARRR